MTTPPATEAQIRATVLSLIERHPEANVFGIRAEPRWTGQEVILLGDRPVRVVGCVSPLAAREALLKADDQPERLVLLIDHDQRELGDDVLGRLARRRLFTPDPWEALRGLFKAENLDPRLTDERGLASALIEAVPSGEFPAAPGAFLTADLAWGTLLERRLELPRDPTLAHLLAWTQRERGVRLWDGVPADLRESIRARLADTLGPAAPAVLDLVASGRADDALPLGLALVVLFSESEQGLQDRRIAQVRLEGLLSGPLLPAAAVAWGTESERLVRDRLGANDTMEAREQIGRAQRLLAELGAADHAYLSDLIEAGFDQRLAALAFAAERCAAGEAAGDLPRALADVERHAFARLEPQRVRAARMAARLARWLSGPGADPWAPPSFVDAAMGHTAELAFVDWARRSLWAVDRTESVSAVYSRLTVAADRARGERDRRFADLLAGWLDAGASPGGLVLLERVLDDVIAPLAAEQPVLMLVADGMSVDVAHELVGEMVRRGWTELAAEGVDRSLTGVACLPTVTEVCRTSLLSGQLLQGDSGREERRFRDHPALVAVSAANAPPVLFHRGDLTGEGAQRLPEDVRAAVGDPRRRVVGVVVNAVDDLLMKGGQLAPTWTPETVPVLGALMDAAREGNRVVVLVSDHGHIVDRGTTYREPPGGGGERWRAATTSPAADEVLLASSPRVLLGGGRVVAAASESIRYSTSKRDGYHGGATPREVIVPLRVLRAPFGAEPAGWHEIPTLVPDWWDGAMPTPAPIEHEPKTTPRRPAAAGQQSLFGPRPTTGQPVPATGWVKSLLVSEIYRQQAERLGARARLDDDRVAAILTALDARGGTSTRAAVARAAQIPEARIDGILRAMQRLLNVDGYPVLSSTSDEQTVMVNVDLLRAQFGL